MIECSNLPNSEGQQEHLDRCTQEADEPADEEEHDQPQDEFDGIAGHDGKLAGYTTRVRADSKQQAYSKPQVTGVQGCERRCSRLLRQAVTAASQRSELASPSMTRAGP